MNKYLTKIAANRYEAFLDTLTKSHPSLSNPKILKEVLNRRKAHFLASDAAKLVSYSKGSNGHWQLAHRSVPAEKPLNFEQFGELELGRKHLDLSSDLIRHNRFLTRFGD